MSKIYFYWSVPADLRPVVYCSVITQGNEEDWKFFWEKFKAENVAAETVVILNALGCTKSSNLTTVKTKLFDNTRKISIDLFFYCFNRITSTLYSPPMFVCKINMLHLYRHWSKVKISNWFLILWFRIIKTSLKCKYYSLRWFHMTLET